MFIICHIWESKLDGNDVRKRHKMLNFSIITARQSIALEIWSIFLRATDSIHCEIIEPLFRKRPESVSRAI